MQTSHPTALQLEMWHAGECAATVAAHVGACNSCRQVLEELEKERQSLLVRLPPAEFLRMVQSKMTQPDSDRRLRAWLRGGTGSYLMAACVMLTAVVVARPWGSRNLQSEVSARNEPSSGSANEAQTNGSDDWVAKGSADLALIVQRQGRQAVMSGAVTLLPGDQVRVRFQVNRRARWRAGILLDTGQWVPFFEGEFGVGTHTPEATLQVDEHPASGRLVLGAPERVSAFCQGGDANGVQLMEIRSPPSEQAETREAIPE